MEWRSVMTVAGTVGVAFTPNGLSVLQLPAANSQRFSDVTESDLAWLWRLQDDLQAYFNGSPVAFSCPVDVAGYPPFFARALAVTAAIPYGGRLTYRELAEAAGSPRGARAAGQALAANRTPLVVPCHRVVGSSGALGGFSGGTDWKRKLLALEAAGKSSGAS